MFIGFHYTCIRHPCLLAPQFCLELIFHTLIELSEKFNKARGRRIITVLSWIIGFELGWVKGYTGRVHSSNCSATQENLKLATVWKLVHKALLSNPSSKNTKRVYFFCIQKLYFSLTTYAMVITPALIVFDVLKKIVRGIEVNSKHYYFI